uniref:Uncharacterized protein n=1 Tax=Manihot esculenta TaxID=3983 RepID=A0A2C9WCB4_MANES
MAFARVRFPMSAGEREYCAMLHLMMWSLINLSTIVSKKIFQQFVTR